MGTHCGGGDMNVPRRGPNVRPLYLIWAQIRGQLHFLFFSFLANGKNFASIGGLMYRVPYVLLPSEYRLAQSSRGFLI